MKFELGEIKIGIKASKQLDLWSVTAILNNSYRKGDWGNIDKTNKQANDKALKYGDRIVAVYKDVKGIKFLVITEADRSYTTVLLPEEY